MFEASENDDRGRFRYWATVVLLAVNVLAFGGQLAAQAYAPHFPLDDYFALSLDGIRHGFVWQLLTFQFMHGGYLHIILNSWVIFIFGRVIEVSLGWRRMVRLYLLSGVIGGVTQLLGMWLFPGLLPDAAVVGASAGASGLVAAFAVLYPNETLIIFLLFIPLKMRAWSLMCFFIAISVIGIFYPLFQPYVPQYFLIGAMFNNVAHAAHLGGILAGWVMARRLIRRRPVPPVIEPAKTSLNITPVGD